MAMDDARLDMEREERERVGVYIGSALGGVAYAEEQHVDFVSDGIRSIHPMLALAVFCGASSANVAMEIGANGPSLGNSNSCASGTIAVGEAFHAIKRGEIDAAVAGGVEAPLAPLTFGAFAVIKVLSTSNDCPAEASRPFDRDRDGFVMAEGAGLLVLEELGHAMRRDAPIYAEVLGFGITSDAYHMTAPRPDGVQAARSITLALDDAGLPPEALDYVAAHASSTVLNDKTETLAIKRALGDHAYRIPVSGTKGMHAHALGASGGIELVINALVMQRGVLPATVNLVHPDPECDLTYVRDQPVEQRITYMLKNSFGFGGTNAALVLGRLAQ
jgi:3-oxoacyl-[acyl-carrier-protein] synthase II